MISLKRSKKKSEESIAAVPSSGDSYGYGTRITLEKEDLEKLGIKQLPDVGQSMMLDAKVKVISASMREGSRSLELQITDMDLTKGNKDSDDELTREKKGPLSRVSKRMGSM